jgi:hypothetical protein
MVVVGCSLQDFPFISCVLYILTLQDIKITWENQILLFMAVLKTWKSKTNNLKN